MYVKQNSVLGGRLSRRAALGESMRRGNHTSYRTWTRIARVILDICHDQNNKHRATKATPIFKGRALTVPRRPPVDDEATRFNEWQTTTRKICQEEFGVSKMVTKTLPSKA